MKLLDTQPKLPSWRGGNIRCEYTRDIPRPVWDTSTTYNQCRWSARFEHGGKKLCVTHAKHVALLAILELEQQRSRTP